MKKIICFTSYPADAPSVYHRVAAYTDLFAAAGFELKIVSFMTQGLYQKRRRFGALMTLYKLLMFAWCSLRLCFRLPLALFCEAVIIHREVFPLGKPWFERLIISLSKKCLYDLDDAIWLPPSNGVNQRGFLWDDNRVANIMKHADIVLAGNNFIADYASKHNDKIAIIPTGYDDLTNSKKKKVNEIPKLVWIGNWGNAHYLQFILPALESAYASAPFELVLIGATDIFDIKSSVVKIHYYLWSREREHTLLPSCDIGIMPLVDEGYEQGKCAFKLIQYMASGLALIGTPVGMNRDVILPATGFQASSLKEWETSITRLCIDKELRDSMSQTAYSNFYHTYRREHIFNALIANINECKELEHESA